MLRRDFIKVIGGTAATWPFSALAQQGERVRRIGVLFGLTENDPEAQARFAAIRQGLQDLKWVEGRNIRIDVRWGTGDAARVKYYAAELVKLAPDVILGTNTPLMRALKQETQTIPIVFAGLSDPIGDGLVTSLSKPGGNITGFSSFDPAIAGKWLQILKEISPSMVRVAILYNPDTAPHSIFLPVLEAAAPAVGVKLIRAMVREPAGIEKVFAELAGTPAGGLIVMPDLFVASHRALVIRNAAQHRLPTIYPVPFWAVEGGLMSYGPDFVDQHKKAATYIDRILKGEKPADLPVQTPTKFDLVINMKTANSFGLKIPDKLLFTADKVIE